MSDAARKRQERSSAIARGRFSLARAVARSGLNCVCGVRYAPTGNDGSPIGRLRTTPAGSSTTTRAARISDRVGNDGAAGPPHQHAALHPAARTSPAPSGALPSGRCQAPLSACSRQPHLRRASVVSTSKAGTDDAGNTASCKVAVPDCRDNGRTTGFAARYLPDGLGGLNSPLQQDDKSCLNPSRGANRRAEALPIRKKRIVLTALLNTCGISPTGSGH